MERMTKSILINAPVEKVFAYMEDASNLPEIWPSMIEITNIKVDQKGFATYDWTYKMAGVHIKGASKTLEYVPNKRIVVTNEKGVESKFTWDYYPESNGTKLSVEAEYAIPGSVLGKLAKSFIIKQNEREADTLLENLKVRMET